MTEEQRQHAIVLCNRILETAARLQADLQATAAVMKKEIETVLSPSLGDETRASKERPDPGRHGPGYPPG